MSCEPKQFSSHHNWQLTAILLIAIVVALALANVSSEPVSRYDIERIANGPERAYGWPFTWYWRSAATVPGTIQPWVGSPRRSVVRWPLAKSSPSALAADLAIWLALLAGSAAVCRRLLRRYQLRFHWRPRFTTIILLLAIVAPTALANMTFDVSPLSAPYLGARGATVKALFGWPFVWHWYFVAPFENLYGWDFNAPRLAANMVTWFGTLVLAAMVWEWLIRRSRPRLRFSLRTLLAAVALMSLLCALCVVARKRADDQDAVAAFSMNGRDLRVERWGPKWLSLLGADRFRRRVISASITVGDRIWINGPDEDAEHDDQLPENDEDYGDSLDDESVMDDEGTSENEDGTNDELLNRLVNLPGLRFLDIEYGLVSTATADALAKIRQVRGLNLKIPEYVRWQDRPVNITWLGNLDQIEQLSMVGVRGDEIACLTRLAHLESLALDISDCEDDEAEMDRRLVAIGKLTQLRRLRLQGYPGAHLAHLGNLRDLKSLALDFGDFREYRKECFEALGKLTQIENLRLRKHGGLRIYADELACLSGLTNLKSLTLDMPSDRIDSRACLAVISKLTHLQRLYLGGELVSNGLDELAPLESLEELESDFRMATPEAITSLTALKRLRGVHITGLDLASSTELQQELRQTFGWGVNPAFSTENADKLRRAVNLLRQSRPGIVIDGDADTLLEEHKADFPWMYDGEPFHDSASDLDSFLGYIVFGP